MLEDYNERGAWVMKRKSHSEIFLSGEILPKGEENRSLDSAEIRHASGETHDPRLWRGRTTL